VSIAFQWDTLSGRLQRLIGIWPASWLARAPRTTWRPCCYAPWRSPRSGA
jgi:hypothetical protein